MIHAGERTVAAAAPLTTPIYETTTFVFDTAQEVVAYNEGRSSRYLYSRYGNPTVVSVEQKLAALDDAEAALLFSSGMGATDDDPDGAPARRATRSSAARRSTAARCTCCTTC